MAGAPTNGLETRGRVGSSAWAIDGRDNRLDGIGNGRFRARNDFCLSGYEVVRDGVLGSRERSARLDHLVVVSLTTR
jgi:hypothetical protein